MNFPVINDNRTIGLLRKYRTELSSAIASSQTVGYSNRGGGTTTGEVLDTYNLKLAELEKKLIEENLEKMRYTDEKQKLVTRL
jgi:hypothetical protein